MRSVRVGRTARNSLLRPGRADLSHGQRPALPREGRAHYRASRAIFAPPVCTFYPYFNILTFESDPIGWTLGGGLFIIFKRIVQIRGGT